MANLGSSGQPNSLQKRKTQSGHERPEPTPIAVIYMVGQTIAELTE
jgi:hypothetical protein